MYNYAIVIGILQSGCHYLKQVRYCHFLGIWNVFIVDMFFLFFFFFFFFDNVHDEIYVDILIYTKDIRMYFSFIYASDLIL